MMLSDGWCRVCQRPAPTAKHTGVCRHCQQAHDIAQPLVRWLSQTTPLLLPRPQYGVMRVALYQGGAVILVRPPTAMRKGHIGVTWCAVAVTPTSVRCEAATQRYTAEKIFDGMLPPLAHRGVAQCTSGHEIITNGKGALVCPKCGGSTRVIMDGEPVVEVVAPKPTPKRRPPQVVTPTTTPLDSIRNRRALLRLVPKDL